MENLPEGIRFAVGLLVSFGLILFGGAFILMNLAIVAEKHFRPNAPFKSLVWCIGGIACTIGFLLSPLSQVRWFFWLPLVLDITLGGFPIFLAYLLCMRWAENRRQV